MVGTALAADGVAISNGVALEGVERLDDRGKARLRLSSGMVIEVDRVLVAAGRRPATVDRAITSGETRGFGKLIAGPRRLLRNAGGGRLFGATVGATVGAPTGGELIHEAALAMCTRMFTGRLAPTTHAYPTWSTVIQQAAAQFFFELDGRAARPARRP